MTRVSSVTYRVLFLSVAIGWAGAFSLASQLFLFTENVGMSLTETSLLHVLIQVPVSLSMIVLAPVLDTVTHPWLLLAALSVAVLARYVVAFFVAYATAPVLVGLAYVWLFFSDRLCGSILTLTLKRSLEADFLAAEPQAKHSAQVRIFSLQYSLDNLGISLSAFLYQSTKWLVPTAVEDNLLVLFWGTVALHLCLAGAFLLVPVWLHVHDQTAPTTPAAIECNPCRVWLPFFRTANFWRYVAVTLLLQCVAVTFVFNDISLPYIMMAHHPLGKDVPFLIVQSINPALITVGAPLIQYITSRHVDTYAMLTIGVGMTALSTLLVLLLPPAALWTYILYMVCFSLAEATWSPRVTAYIFSVAPRGKEAAYLAASAVPTLAVRLAERYVTGAVADHYCPKDSVGQPALCQPEKIWLIAFVLSASASVILLVTQRWLRNKSSV